VPADGGPPPHLGIRLVGQSDQMPAGDHGGCRGQRRRRVERDQSMGSRLAAG